MFMLGSLLVVAGRLVWVQGVSSGHFVALAAGQRDHTVTLAARRGSIVDRKGETLAMSVDAKTLIADPHLIVSPQATAQTLAPMLGVPASDLQTRLSNGTGFAYLARRIDPQLAASVVALGIPGIQSITEPLRVYPDGQLAAMSSDSPAPTPRAWPAWRPGTTRCCPATPATWPCRQIPRAGSSSRPSRR